MKPVIIIAIAFVLLIPLTALAQESLDCPKGTYHGLDNNGNDACRDIETNTIVKQQTMVDNSSSEDNPISMFFNMLMKGLANIFSFGSIEESVESVSDSVGKSVEILSDSIPMDMGLKLTSPKPELTDSEKNELYADWRENRFTEKYIQIEIDCPDHPMTAGSFVFDPNKIDNAIFERCILP